MDEKQHAVAGAKVRLEPGSRVAVTDAGGCFRLESLPLARLTLTVTAKGFFSGTRAEVDLSAAPSQEIEISLQRQSVLEQSVVVTGSGTQSLIVEAPLRTELISRELVQARESRTLSDALTATVPGVRIENNCQNCGWSAVRLNGMEGQYTQVLEDGLPTVSGANMVYALDQLPTEFFENVEVVKGGVSSLYGPNAVAGVINMVRREPQTNMFQVDLSSGQYKGRPEHTGGFVGATNPTRAAAPCSGASWAATRASPSAAARSRTSAAAATAWMWPRTRPTSPSRSLRAVRPASSAGTTRSTRISTTTFPPASAT